MSSQPNHYEALGLPSTATAEQIKRKYRELARQYHPDVNPSPDASGKILSINQAYGVLGDKERRAAYDAEQALRAPQKTSVRPASPTSTPPRPHRPTESHRPVDPTRQSSAGVFYDGFGRSYPKPKGDRRPAGETGGRQRSVPDPKGRSIDQMLAEARLAFINRDLATARGLCIDVLTLNPREAIAHEIIGDVYLREGDEQRASTAFGYAIQLNPRNQTVQAKLNRMMHGATEPNAGPARGMGVPSCIGLEDALPPLGRDAGAVVLDPDPDHTLGHAPIEPDVRPGRRVLDRILDEMLQDLAEARRVGQRVETDPTFDLHLVPAQERRQSAEHLADELGDIHRLDGGRLVRDNADRREDRIDKAVEALDLADRAVVPVGSLSAACRIPGIATIELGLLGQEVGVGANDGQRRPQFVRDDGDELGSCLVDGLELGRAYFRLLLLATLLDDAGKQVGNGAELRHVRVAELSPGLGLDVQYAHDPIAPGERHGQHRGDESALVDPADPQESGIRFDIGNDDRIAALRHPPGHAFAEWHPGPADLESVEAVGGGEREVRSISIEEIERGDVRMECVAGLIDHGLEQLVPGLRGGRQARHAMQEPELLELLGSGHRDQFRIRHGDHDTKVRADAGRVGCGEVQRTLRIGVDRNLRTAA